MGPNLFERLSDKFGDAILGNASDEVDPWIEIDSAQLRRVCEFLKHDPELRYNLLNCITAVDYLHTDPKKAAKVDWQPHLMLVYHLSSTIHKRTCVIKARLPRWKDDVEGQLPEIDSVANIWRTADWHEREVYDLSGVRFVGHPDLRRILCPEDWVGHPLRKDYEMPTEYHGIRAQ
jgi:NADH-quinone oxidoreductase subunit C